MHLISCAVTIALALGIRSCSCDVLVYTQATNQVIIINIVKVTVFIFITKISLLDYRGISIACGTIRPQPPTKWIEGVGSCSRPRRRLRPDGRSTENKFYVPWNHAKVCRDGCSWNLLVRWYELNKIVGIATNCLLCR